MFFGAYCVPGDGEMDEAVPFSSESTIWCRGVTCGKTSGPQRKHGEMLTLAALERGIGTWGGSTLFFFFNIF